MACSKDSNVDTSEIIRMIADAKESLESLLAMANLSANDVVRYVSNSMSLQEKEIYQTKMKQIRLHLMHKLGAVKGRCTDVGGERKVSSPIYTEHSLATQSSTTLPLTNTNCVQSANAIRSPSINATASSASNVVSAPSNDFTCNINVISGVDNSTAAATISQPSVRVALKTEHPDGISKTVKKMKLNVLTAQGTSTDDPQQPQYCSERNTNRDRCNEQQRSDRIRPGVHDKDRNLPSITGYSDGICSIAFHRSKDVECRNLDNGDMIRRGKSANNERRHLEGKHSSRQVLQSHANMIRNCSKGRVDNSRSAMLQRFTEFVEVIRRQAHEYLERFKLSGSVFTFDHAASDHIGYSIETRRMCGLLYKRR